MTIFIFPSCNIDHSSTFVTRHTSFRNKAGFVESFGTGSTGSAGTGFGRAAVNIPRTLAVTVFRIAYLAAFARAAATVRTAVGAVRTVCLITQRRTVLFAAVSRLMIAGIARPACFYGCRNAAGRAGRCGVRAV